MTIPNRHSPSSLHSFSLTFLLSLSPFSFPSLLAHSWMTNVRLATLLQALNKTMSTVIKTKHSTFNRVWIFLCQSAAPSRPCSAFALFSVWWFWHICIHILTHTRASAIKINRIITLTSEQLYNMCKLGNWLSGWDDFAHNKYCDELCMRTTDRYTLQTSSMTHLDNELTSHASFSLHLMSLRPVSPPLPSTFYLPDLLCYAMRYVVYALCYELCRMNVYFEQAQHLIKQAIIHIFANWLNLHQLVSGCVCVCASVPFAETHNVWNYCYTYVF